MERRTRTRRSLAFSWATLFTLSLLLQSIGLAAAPAAFAEEAYTLEISTAASASTVASGGSVHDDATLVGDDGPAPGTVTFFVCAPAEVTAAGCPSGGTQVASPVAVTITDLGGTAQSPTFSVGDTADAAGMYCWRAEYAPDPATGYQPETHTDASAECFTVDAPSVDPVPDEPNTDIQVTKTPDGGTVTIGGTITWTIDVTNLGDGIATHVVMTDPLPAGVEWTEDESICEITGPVGSQVLTCNVGNLTAHHTRSYTVTGKATGEICGLLTNTASATADLEADDLLGNNSDSATVTVLCGLIAVTKFGNPWGPISAGDQIGFDITVSNLGTAPVTGVHMTDALPAGFDWTIGSTGGDSCAITGPVGSQVLTCDDTFMAPGDFFITHVQAQTDAADCGKVYNAVFVTSTDGGNADAMATVEVQCPALGISKTPDHESPVQLGSQIGFTITATNTATGTANDVHVSDALDARFSWSIESTSGALTWTLAGNQLSASGNLPTGSSSVHVVATTPTTDTEGHCGLVPNTAFLTQGSGEGEVAIDDASAAENVLCAEIGEFHPGGECDANTPYLVYDVPVLNLPGATSVTITFVNPDGPDIVFPNQPLSGRILWPGAVLDADGNIIDWPGWTLLSDGTWVQGDEFSWTRPTVEIRFEVNPEATVTVDYPPASTACADPPPNLGIVKVNDAPIQTIPTPDGPIDLPTAKVGDTVSYTLTYNTNGVAQHHGVITDVLPDGITYVDGTATSNDEFAFVGYTPSTRTLRWEAAVVTKGGTLTYDVTIGAGAAELPQPLVNVATIVTDEQPSDDANSPVFVGTIPQDLPPTDALAPSATPGNPGPALMLLLLIALAIGFLSPVPEHVRRRHRR